MASREKPDRQCGDAEERSALPPGFNPNMDEAPKDRPILGWCVHSADPYWIEPADATGREVLTLYGGHTEGLSHVEDGPNVLVWGGAWDDRSHEYDGGHMPDWWFLRGSEFEVTANPIGWIDIPEPTHAP